MPCLASSRRRGCSCRSGARTSVEPGEPLVLAVLGLDQQRASAGVRVSATTPESTTATATVTANCLYSWPAMPPRKATGTNTAHSTSTMATTAPETCCIARLIAACFGGSRFFGHQLRSTFSSDDDRVIDDDTDGEHHREQRQRVDRKPNSQRPAKVPISEIGTATIGISCRQLCRKMKTTASTSTMASTRS